MQVKTTGIVLHSIKYSDSANIVTVYTRHFGRVSYMVHGVNKKKSICRPAYLQALSILDLDVYHVPGKSIQRIKDIRTMYQFTGIPVDPVKNAVALFIAEILFRTLWQTEPDENVFLFLENSVQQLDCCETGISNFHLVFLLKLTRYLGFEPNHDEESFMYFDLMNGVFLKEKPLHSHFLMPEDAIDFEASLHSDYSNMSQLNLSRVKRQKLLESMVEYYRLHIPDFHGLNSLAVLQSLFD
ncbi:MAG: DNA repair protein RecO [Paludibacter sp.]|nr:DNA repair protein RecO [Paludibacter sp.]